MKIVVIPDSHAAPDESLARYVAISNYLVKERPDVIVNIGDHADMSSLSVYDRGKLSFEGKRYLADIEAAKEANRRMFKGVRKLQAKQKYNKKAIYRPRTVMTLGNHENRIRHEVARNPALAGFMTMADLGYEEYYQEIYDYLDPVVIEGIAFSHAFVGGVMGKPMGGVNHARSILLKNHMSSVCGHSHLFDYAEDTTVAGTKLQSLVVGCCVEEPPHWTNSQQYQLWTSGLVTLRNVSNGTFDYEKVSLETLFKYY